MIVRAWDDMSGKELDVKEARAARKEDMRYIVDKAVSSPRSESRKPCRSIKLMIKASSEAIDMNLLGCPGNANLQPTSARPGGAQDQKPGGCES